MAAAAQHLGADGSARPTAGADASARPTAGAAIDLRIGQRVRLHRDYQGQRIVGILRGLHEDSDGRLCADIALDKSLVLPAYGEHPESHIHRQFVPVQEVSPFDERDELIDALLDVARRVDEMLTRQKWTPGDFDPEAQLLRDARAAVAKTQGGAA